MSETYLRDISAFVGLVPPYTVPAPDRLTNEVEESITSVPLESVTVNPPGQDDKTEFVFESALNPTQEGLLDDVVAAHSGQPLPDPGPDPTSHDALIDVTENQHHPRLHAATHGSGQEDAVTLAPAQVGADQAAFNANKLQGREVSAAAPSDQQVLTWDQGANGWRPLDAQGGGGFPENYYAESEGNSATTSASDVKKVVLTETFSGGIYTLWWYAEVWSCSLNAHNRVKVWVDDEVVAWVDLTMNGRYNENPAPGVKQVKLDAGEHTIILSFARVEYCTAYIRRARLFVQKVGE